MNLCCLIVEHYEFSVGGGRRKWAGTRHTRRSDETQMDKFSIAQFNFMKICMKMRKAILFLKQNHQEGGSATSMHVAGGFSVSMCLGAIHYGAIVMKHLKQKLWWLGTFRVVEEIFQEKILPLKSKKVTPLQVTIFKNLLGLELCKVFVNKK